MILFIAAVLGFLIFIGYRISRRSAGPVEGYGPGASSARSSSPFRTPGKQPGRGF